MQAPGGTPPPGAVATGAPESRGPSEAQIKSAQRAQIKSVERSHTQQDRQLQAAQRADAIPGPSTAPAGVLRLARRAAKVWIGYRINGVRPSARVIPRSLWDSVPPAAPADRMKGAALMTGMHAYSAHPQDDGWVVSVSSRDPRMPVLVVEVDGPATAPKVSGISG